MRFSLLTEKSITTAVKKKTTTKNKTTKKDPEIHRHAAPSAGLACLSDIYAFTEYITTGRRREKPYKQKHIMEICLVRIRQEKSRRVEFP